jgi:hypothetical protein
VEQQLQSMDRIKEDKDIEAKRRRIWNIGLWKNKQMNLKPN